MSSLSNALAGIVARALGSDWAELLENFGLWIPIKIINKEHDDKPEGEEEFGNDSIFFVLKINYFVSPIHFTD